MNRILCAGIATLFVAGAVLAQDELIPGNGNGNGHANGRGFLKGHARPGGGGSTPVITYHGGPVMLGTTAVYYIYYGNWSVDPNASTILQNFANNIGGSPYFNIETSYYDGANRNISNSVVFAGSVVSDYIAANPTNLSDNDIFGILKKAITKGLPVDPNAVYFVLTAPGVGESSGFLTQYCGWHTYGTVNGTNLKFSFVGNASANLAVCSAQTSKSPNGDPAVDAMISVLAHELEESVSDPLLNAWYDSNGDENADKCAWTFGSTYAAPNGSAANMTLGGFNFLIQQNWVNSGAGYCALSYAAASDYSLSVTNAPSVQQGGTTTNYTVKVNPTNNFSGQVTLAVSGLPVGAAANGPSPNPTTSTATFTISTSAGLSAGTYGFTITGSSSGLTNHTVQGTLIVTTAGTMTVSMAPPSLTVKRGNKGTYTVTVSGTGGFNANTQLSVSGLPSRVSGSFSPSSVSGGSGTSTLTINAPKNAGTGTSTITVTATGGGLTKTTTASLTIN